MPSSGQITARKGGAVTLECKASGNPVPSIYWTKKVCIMFAYQKHTNFAVAFATKKNKFWWNTFSLPQSGSGKSQARIGEGPILTLERVERLQSGVFQCTAENNVGEPVTVDMRLDVLCKLTCSGWYKRFYKIIMWNPLDKLSACYWFTTQFSISIMAWSSRKLCMKHSTVNFCSALPLHGRVKPQKSILQNNLWLCSP